MEARPCVGFASLPRLLALDIFARLPADARLLLALVSPSWRALVAEPSLWACVDLSEASGVTRASDALLLAVSAKACGGMRTLDVRGRVWAAYEFTHEKLRPPISLTGPLTTLQNNAQSLRHLRALCPPLNTTCWQYLFGTSAAVLDDLLHAAPELTRIEVDISVAEFDTSVLRNGVVSVRRLSVQNPHASLYAVLMDQCSSLSELELYGGMDTEPEIEALVDFALDKPLTALNLIQSGLTLDAMPSLTRLLSGTMLATLEVFNNGNVLVPSPAFSAAVAAAPLVRLNYFQAGLFDTLNAGLSLLAAVTRHPTLRYLSSAANPVAPVGRTAVGAALGLLVAADSPLNVLDITCCELGNDGLLPFIDALPRNTHLRRLYCGWNHVTQPAAARLLAAVRANASLIFLKAPEVDDNTELLRAQEVVAARAT